MPLWRLRGKRWSGYLSWRRRRRFEHRQDVLEHLTEAVLAEDPVQILVTGDLVHVGLPEEIRAAVHWLESLGSPDRIMLVPGNHDVYARDSWPALARAWEPWLTAGTPLTGADDTFPRYRRLDTDAGALCLIGLSSAVPSPLFMASGRLGARQCERLDALLAAADGFRCVLVHHPPLPAMSRWRKGLRDAASLERVLARRGAELILHGHVHENVTRRGPGHAHVYGTASASSSRADCPAAYRRFDVARVGGEWRVDMRLVSVVPDGGCRVTASESWSAAVRPPASGP